MQMFTDDQPLPLGQRGGGWLIGNFDGVHQGHRAIITELRQRWGAVKVLTFEPHPRQYFGQPLLRLTDATARTARLQQLGVGVILQRRFDAAFAALSASDFIAQILHGQCGAEKIAVGEGFRFGVGRSGDVALLQHSFGPANVTIMPVVRDATGQPYSSTRIRAALTAGDAALAQALLGWPNG
jgi:riboflavin kinase/FMN adenylyltransferase